MTASRPHVVVIGGGFGGLNAVQKLAEHDEVDVTLIDRRNHHLFQPLLYQVATAALNPSDIAYPLRSVVSKYRNVRVLLGDVTAIDTERKEVVLDAGELDYDYLIVATGATHSYFGHDEWAKCAPGLKSVEDAVDIRNRIYLAYEAAEREPDPELTREWMTFVVVGAGPTGVELAGALAEIGRHTLAKDFRAIDPTDIRVVLVEGLDRVLPPYPQKLSAHAKRELEKRGVEVMLGSFVTGIDERGVDIGDRRIPARTVLWAAGVQASPLARTLGVPLDKAGRVCVNEDLSIPGHPEVFVIGDLAHFEQDGTLIGGVAQVAIQGGKHAAENIIRLVEGYETLQFRYHDKGSMATIGRSSAVVDAGPLKFGGFWAWIFWWLVHITFLIGFRNRILVVFNWAWQYITFQRGARLITGDHGVLPRIADVPDEEPQQAAQQRSAASG